MRDLINEIVDMDRKAREITDDAQAQKVNSEKEIVKLREQIRTEYLEHARKRIALNQPSERAAAEKAWELAQAKHEKISEHLETLYQNKADEWVNTIVARVTGGV